MITWFLIAQVQLTGIWLLTDQDWGFELFENGSARSVNSATLMIEKWRIEDHRLCLTMTQRGNGQSDETCYEHQIRGNRLILQKGSKHWTYQR